MSKIQKILSSDEKISGRGGLVLFLRYIQQVGFIKMAIDMFDLASPHKGLSLSGFLQQMMAHLMNGDAMAMVDFDRKKKDEGYAAVLETTTDGLCSSHQIKRFFIKMADKVKQSTYRKVLYELFIWRLKLAKPNVVVLGIDTMVLDNDQALQREGSEPTYKKKKGFQPLHLFWGRFLIDVVFRKGSAHSNHGTDYIDSVKAIVKLIRKRYKDVPVILLADGGFFDQKAFECFEQDSKIGYVVMGKKYEDDRQYLQDIPNNAYKVYQKGKCAWQYLEYGHKLKSWNKFRRCIYTRLACEDTGQTIFDFAQTDSIIYTNLGVDDTFSQQLRQAGYGHYLQTDQIIGLAHSRGADELVHRSIKEMATKEQLPFKGFEMNGSYYYLLAFCHFLFECFKEDVSKEVVAVTSYPNTLRRKLIDIGVKVVTHAGQTVMKAARAAFESLQLDKLWELCQAPPPIRWQST